MVVVKASVVQTVVDLYIVRDNVDRKTSIPQVPREENCMILHPPTTE